MNVLGCIFIKTLGFIYLEAVRIQQDSFLVASKNHTCREFDRGL